MNQHKNKKEIMLQRAIRDLLIALAPRLDPDGEEQTEDSKEFTLDEEALEDSLSNLVD